MALDVINEHGFRQKAAEILENWRPLLQSTTPVDNEVQPLSDSLKPESDGDKSCRRWGVRRRSEDICMPIVTGVKVLWHALCLSFKQGTKLGR